MSTTDPAREPASDTQRDQGSDLGPQQHGMDPSPRLSRRLANVSATARRGRVWPPQPLWERSGAANLWRGILGAGSGAAPDPPSPSYAVARTWSPVVVPVALWTVLVALGALVASHPLAHYTDMWRHVKLLAAVLLVLGAALGLALRRARNDTIWTATLGLGMLVFLMAFVFTLFGPKAGIAATAVLAFGAGLFVRERLHPVMAGTVHVTALPRHQHRTLMPGVNVLLPGERLLAILTTQRRQYTTPPQSVSLSTGDAAEATATICYELIPERAELAVLTGRDWERGLRRLLSAVVRDELQRWLVDAPHADSPPPDEHFTSATQGTAPDQERMRLRIERRVAVEAARWGVRILSLTLEHLTLVTRATPRPMLPAPAVASPGPGAPKVVDGWLVPTRDLSSAQPPAPVGPRPAPSAITRPLAEVRIARSAVAFQASDSHDDSTPASSPPRWLARPRRAVASLRARIIGQRAPEDARESGESALRPEHQPSAGQDGSNGDGANRPTDRSPEGESASPPLSPHVLANMYEAVREGRISDPATVRSIANTFARLAAMPEADDNLEFDPEQAARNLAQRAEQLGASRDAQPDDLAADQSAPPGRTVPPSPPRDENVLRGG
ncbi:MAG TPA: SPFH domain-containing protein [Ktedonobacterales bacterium]